MIEIYSITGLIIGFLVGVFVGYRFLKPTLHQRRKAALDYEKQIAKMMEKYDIRVKSPHVVHK